MRKGRILVDGKPIAQFCREQFFRQADGEITPDELRKIIDEKLPRKNQLNLFHNPHITVRHYHCCCDGDHHTAD